MPFIFAVPLLVIGIFKTIFPM